MNANQRGILMSEKLSEPLIYDSVDVFRLLGYAIADAGSQREFADLHGFTAPYISLVATGKRPISPRMLKALGLRKVVRFVSVGEKT